MAEFETVSRMQRRDPSPDAGFLLVEALATLAISAFILAALGSLIGLMSRQTDYLAARVARFDASERVLATLAREIGSAARVRWSGRGPRAFVFAGSPGHLVFALDRPIGNGLTETVAVSFETVTVADRTRLTRLEAPLPPTYSSAADLVFSEPQPLDTGPVSVRFAYVTQVAADGPEILLDDWSESFVMPDAVRIALVRTGTDHILSSLRVPLRLQAEPGCLKAKTAFCSRIDVDAPSDPDDAPSVASILGTMHLQQR